MGPCPVDGTVITDLLLYIDPDNGGYDGTMTIDWISTISPLEAIEEEDNGPLGIDEYSDGMDDNSLDFITDNDGIVSTAEEGQLKMIGNGTSGAFATVTYELHQGLDSVIVNAESNMGKVFVRARSTVDGLPVRIDLQDSRGYVTSLAGLTQGMTTEFTTYEFDFTGNYTDGGFGGTPCESGPCPVDQNRIQQLLFYLDPGIGSFDGEFHIDWISFGTPLVTSNVVDLDQLNDGVVYPNPVNDQVTIDIDSKYDGFASVRLVDISGSVVLQQNFGHRSAGKNIDVIDVSQIPEGFYMINYELDNQVILSSKLIKQ
jgi:hypothetical protein